MKHSSETESQTHFKHRLSSPEILRVLHRIRGKNAHVIAYLQLHRICINDPEKVFIIVSDYTAKCVLHTELNFNNSCKGRE
jgi:hypothetical protein